MEDSKKGVLTLLFGGTHKVSGSLVALLIGISCAWTILRLASNCWGSVLWGVDL